MKKKFIHVGKRTLSVVLSIMMIVSTMLIGTITSVSAAFIQSGTKVYFDNSKTKWSEVHMFVYQNTLSSPNHTVDWEFTPISGSNYYECTVAGYNANAKYIFHDGTTKDGASRTVELTDGLQSSWWATCYTPSALNTNWTGAYKAVGVKNVALDKNNTTTTGGSGTVDDPYTVLPGTSISVKASAELISTDHSAAKQYSFTVDSGNASDYSTTDTYTVVSSAVAGTTYSVKADIRSYCNAATLSGGTTTNTLYFKAETSYIYLKNQANWTSVNAYFFNDNGKVGTEYPGDSMELVGTDESIYKIAIPAGATKVKFSQNADSTKNSGDLTIGENQVYNNSSSTYKNWYSFDTTANYSVIGPVAGSTDWNTTTLVSEKVDDYGTYKLDVTITDPETQGFFRIKKGTQEYGPYNASNSSATNFEITNTNTPASAYQASVDYHSKAFSISESGEYSIYVRNSYMKDNAAKENRPDVWVVRKGDIPVTNPTIKFGVNGTNGTLTAKSDTTDITSGKTVTSGSSVTFTATPAENYKVEGWYSDEACETAISGVSGSEYTVENVTSDLTVYVKFTSTSQPVGNAPVLHKYDPSASGTGSIASSGANDLLNKAMNYYTDSTYTYYYYDITDGGKYLYNITLDGVTFYKGVQDKYENSVYMNNNWSQLTDIFETGNNISHYYIIYTPSMDADKRISVVTTLPGSTPPAPETYNVTMTQGVLSKVNGAMGSSYLDGDTTNTQIEKSFDDLTVTFTTKTKFVTSTGDSSLNYTGYMYQVYGYSVLMTLQDGTKQVDAVVNPLNDNNSASPISPLANGVYQCDYTFPSNIKSAVVTPVFTVSDDYASASENNISFTALYLKVTPGNNVFSNTYEPRYYTWRGAATNSQTGEPFVVEKNGRNLEREPEGAYGGQIMLHTNDDMYIAYVQSDIYGILFDDGGNVQSFDFNEFIKLQKLGYNNITFEPKTGSGNTVSTGINGKIGTDVNNFYQTYDNGPVVTIDDYVDTDFELDVDIEGYYIDVFGDRLKDTNGNEIKRATVLSSIDSSTTVTTSVELAKLFEIAGIATDKQNEIFGARYGWYSTADRNYGMNYAVRNYFIDGTSKKIISQQISGFGTIEGAQSPEDPTKNNAAYMYAKDSTNPLTYYYGTIPLGTNQTADNVKKGNFETGYELISDKYKNLPYLVSYKKATTVRATTDDVNQENYTRIDGKWYYMSSVPQITITAKVGLMKANGTIEMTDGIIKDYTNNLNGCSATVNLQSSATIDQGSSAILRAYTAGGYVFAGFYEENGRFISASNPYEKVFANHSNVYAVFKTIESGTLTVTNNIYNSILSNPAPGGGSGSISVQLIVQHKNDDGTYSKAETVSGTNSASVAIKDGDIFQWKITGKATGADEFIAFRQLSTLADGKTSYYVALDDEVCLSCDNTTNTYTYTSYKCEWNWFKQTGTSEEGSLFKTFDFYTDFQKVSSFATLNYKYVNRFDEVKIYTVKNVPLDYNQVQQNNYKPTNEMILTYAPPIDEVFKDCEWMITDVTLLDRSNSVATLEAIQEKKQYTTYINNGVDPYPTFKKAYFNESIQLKANEKKGEQSFSYWKRYLTDNTGKKSGEGEIFSYQRSISVRVTFNSYFEAVYGADLGKYYTNLQDPVYTREKFTDKNGNTTDYVYADFLLQFDSSDPNKTFADIVKNSGGSVKFGIVLERDTKYSYDGEGDITAPVTTSTTYDLDLKKTILSLGKDLAAGGTAKGWNTGTTTTDPEYNYYYYLYDLTDKADALSTLGRYDLIFRYNNTESNRSKVYNAYTYIIYTDDKNNKQIVISKPKVLSIYETGIKADGSTSSTTTA